jgi:PEP-CTERM motif
VNRYFIFTAAPLLLAVSATSVHATSAATATLSFGALSTSGFSWVADPVSSSTTDASAAGLLGWTFAAGVFSPNYGPAAVGNQLVVGTAVPSTVVDADAGVARGSASSRTVGQGAELLANATVTTQGKAEATSFARSWFSLDAGATVTFSGTVAVAAEGVNTSVPAGYNSGDFYSFASGLMAVGAQVLSIELGGPLTTGAVGNYSLTNGSTWNLTVTNTDTSPLLTYLDSGVTVYTASPVPEPGTYALLLAGLWGVGLFVRRQGDRR